MEAWDTFATTQGILKKGGEAKQTKVGAVVSIAAMSIIALYGVYLLSTLLSSTVVDIDIHSVSVTHDQLTQEDTHLDQLHIEGCLVEIDSETGEEAWCIDINPGYGEFKTWQVTETDATDVVQGPERLATAHYDATLNETWYGLDM